MAVILFVYDTCFHSLDDEQRRYPEQYQFNARFAPVKIGNNVFVGAHSTMRGVTIGDSSVVVACSIVARNIPGNDIWVGNPSVSTRKAIPPGAPFKLKDGEA